MIFIIGKKQRCKKPLFKFAKSKFDHEYIEYFSQNKFLLKNKKKTEKEIYNYILYCKHEIKIVFLINVSSILKCNWTKFNTFISHGGSLPYYRGASVINWQIINNEKYLTISIVSFSKKLDSGYIIFEKKFLSNKPLTLIRPKIDEWYANSFLKISKILLERKKLFFSKQIGKVSYWPNRTKIYSLVNIYLIKNYLDFKNLVFACEEGYWLNFYINEKDRVFISYCSKSFSKCLSLNRVFKGKIWKLKTINFSCYVIQVL